MVHQPVDHRGGGRRVRFLGGDKQRHAAGGVNGKKPALSVEDDACDPKQARSIAEKIAGAKIPFVAGHCCSSSSFPASEAYADGNVLQTPPTSTNPRFTERNQWNVFRTCGRDDQQGVVAADHVIDDRLGRRLAVLSDDLEPNQVADMQGHAESFGTPGDGIAHRCAGRRQRVDVRTGPERPSRRARRPPGGPLSHPDAVGTAASG